MLDPTIPLIDDPDERRTRETYTAWMRRGLEVVEVLARTDVAADWPAAPATSAYAPRDHAPADDPPPSGIADPRWLVSGPARQSPGATGPLAGLRIGVKDIIDVAGLPTRNGTPRALWRDPPDSAPVWRSLADAGAYCIAKTATHEMAWGVTTPEIGNPLAEERIAGGSSGGSAACVAAGVAHGALGTDTGGSIRIPAALCGVVGFRPSSGAVSGDGITPVAPEQDTAGPLAGDVATCVRLLEQLLDRSLPRSPADPYRLRIGVLANVGALDPQVRRAYDRTIGYLESCGVTVIPCETTAHRDAASVSLLTMLQSSTRQHAAAVHADPSGFGGEARALLTLGEHIARETPLVRAAAEHVTADTARMFTGSDLDAFVTPTVPCLAPRRDAETADIDGRLVPVAAALTRFTSWAAVSGMPAVTVPIPTNDLPTGFQVMAPPGHEEICTGIALLAERAANLDTTGILRSD